MAKRGRPLKLKLVGLDGGRETVDQDAESVTPKAAAMTDTEPPAELMFLARRHWEWLVPQLAELGTVSDLEREVLERYCWLVGKIQEAQRKIESDGLVIETFNSRGNAVEAAHPAVAIWKTLATEARAIEGQLGIGASNRAALKLPNKDKSDDGLGKVRRGRKKAQG